MVRYTAIKNQHQINGEIRDKEVRVISAEGEQLGVMSALEALRLAEEEDLDLVKISPNHEVFKLIECCAGRTHQHDVAALGSRRCGMDTTALLGRLTLLELQGKVRQLPGQVYEKV